MRPSCAPGALSRFARLAVAASFALALAPAAWAVTLTNGIDVSNYQGTNINWTTVKNAGYPFAFTKATEGVDFIDASFTTNMANATAAGVYIGPYHFARIDSNESNHDAADEASDFVASIRPYYDGNPTHVLRPVLDVERVNDNGAPVKAYVSQWVRDFAAVVKTELGLEPIIYANTNYVTNYFEADLAKYDLWLANYNYTPPTLPPASADGVFNGWTIWQYSSTGGVPGITASANVDKDVFQGTLDDLVDRYLAPPSANFDLNNAVDGRDFLAWQRGRGGSVASATFAQGDADRNDAINNADFAVWQAQFGLFIMGTRNAAAVPEPTAAALAVAALLAFASRRQHTI
jgi:GH25 family lysozyme M1 (1,4-beta-N-acetylmuramidase)